MSPESHTPFRRQWSLTKLVPLVAVMTFVAMVAIGEIQVRTSPKWPPPPRHELGGWEIDDPPVLNWAAGLSLPATIPILWMWAHNDAFAYAFDDHQLIVYSPWIFFACCLWYFVSYRLDQSTRRQAWKSPLQRYVVLFVQAFVTLELLYAANAMRPTMWIRGERSAVVCLWAWLLLTVLAWVDFFRRKWPEKTPSLSH